MGLQGQPLSAPWAGTHVALVTPFRRGEVDEEALRRVVHHCIAGGVDGVVPCGTTGEAATLSDEEFRLVVRATLDEANGRVPVFAGTGTNNTRTTISRTAMARDLGCTAALVVTPYYNKPTQAGLLAHYRAVAQAVSGFPQILYNVPSRTAVNLLPATVEALADLPEVVAVKEASGNLSQVQDLLRRVGHRLSVLSGDDALALPMYALGAHGVISVAGNVAPRHMAAIWQKHRAGDAAGAALAQAALFPLFEALFVETNPGPCKAALSLMDIIEDELRLPMVSVAPAVKAQLRTILEPLGLLREA
jgi:4-hydroxy-tetrahydrodipicolinate synthase